MHIIINFIPDKELESDIYVVTCRYLKRIKNVIRKRMRKTEGSGGMGKRERGRQGKREN